MERSASEIYGRDFAVNAVIFEEGDPGSRMYVIQKGRVRIEKKVGAHAVTLAILRPGDFFGEMALLENAPRSATAIVDEAATILEVDETIFRKMVTTNGEIAIRLLRRLSSRLRDANHQIQNFLAADSVARAIEVLRAVALSPMEDGFRPLPADFDAKALATRAGVNVADAEPFAMRFERLGILRRVGGRLQLAPADLLRDFLRYLELHAKYEPLTASELAEVAGLSAEEMNAIVRKVLYAKLGPEGAVDGAKAMADGYQEFLNLKRRFTA